MDSCRFQGAPPQGRPTTRDPMRSGTFMKKFRQLTDGLCLHCLKRTTVNALSKCLKRSLSSNSTWRECRSCPAAAQTRKTKTKCLMTRTTALRRPCRHHLHPLSSPAFILVSLIDVAATETSAICRPHQTSSLKATDLPVSILRLIGSG